MYIVYFSADMYSEQIQTVYKLSKFKVYSSMEAILFRWTFLL